MATKKSRKRVAAPKRQRVLSPHTATEVERRDEPDAVLAGLQAGRTRLDELFPGPGNAGLRQSIAKEGVFKVRHRGVERHFMIDNANPEDPQVISVAAVVRNPGVTEDLLREVDDFVQASTNQRGNLVDLLWQVFRQEGTINNALKKTTSLVAGAGRFKVRKAKKGRGTKADKAQQQLQAVLDEFARRVNGSPEDGVVSGARGIRMLIYRMVRAALIEGSWFGRQTWVDHEVLGEGRFSMPLVIQTISAKYMEPVPELVGTGVELWYWAPDSTLIEQLERPKSKEIRDALKNLVPRDMITKLKRDRKVLLDPALLMHLPHLGNDNSAFGDSFIQPAMFAVAYKRAVESLDLVSMRNLINRLVIIKVGSSDKESPYWDPKVQLVRTAKMNELVEDPGPNMLIVWQGDDVDVTQVSAHESVLDLNERHREADRKIKMSTGTPDAILGGTNDGSKSSAIAQMLAAVTTTDELQAGIEQLLSQIGERIALENNFTDYDVVFEFDITNRLDPMEDRNQRRLDYENGTETIADYIAARGEDPDAKFLRKCFERGLPAETTTWEEAFAPPLGLPGQGPEGGPPGKDPSGASPKGRTPKSVTGDPTRDRAPESRRPEENK